MIFICLFCLGAGCSHVFYQPSSRLFVDPARFNLLYQDIFFKSADGTRLHGWLFPGQGKIKGTVIHFHGNAQNISTHFLNLIWMAKEGYNYFIFDYRGYGQSEGDPSQEGVHQDALAALKEAHQIWKNQGEGQLIVYGQSLGGLIALRALSDDIRVEDVSLIVADSSFGSYQDIAFSKLNSRWFLWPFGPLAYVLVSDRYAADKVLSRIKRPLLVIVGQQDKVVPPQFGQQIYQQAVSQQKWYWEIPEGGHIDIFHRANLAYRQKFMSFLQKLR
jgi:uncharacterized protein